MLIDVARFEFRYQLRNPVFWVSLFIFFLLGFGIAASENVSIGTPGTVHENAPFAIAMAIAVMSFFYLFAITSFVANSIIRDDATGFGPIVKATAIGKRDYVLGRFLGSLGVALLGYLALPTGIAVGAMMPWVDPETVGPNSPVNYLWHYLLIAVPNILLSSALLFGLATITRSMLWSYVGVIIFVMGYMTVTGILGSKIEYQDALARFEPFGLGALSEATRYWTAVEMNTRLIPLNEQMLFNRILAIVLSLLLLGVTYWRFSMAERPASKRQMQKAAREMAKAAMLQPVALDPGKSIVPSYGRATLRAQFLMRLKTEILQALRSPGLKVLIFLGVAMTGATLWFAESMYGTPSHPLTANVIGNVIGGFSLFLLIIAVFYGGELVWRERDVKVNEIIDATPTPNWLITVPKVLAIFAVLMLVNLFAMATGMIFQLIKGAAHIEFGTYFLSFLIPMTLEILLTAILAVFMQVLSPNKYVGWGLMLVWFVGNIFLANMGYQNALYRYGNNPAEPLSDMNGNGGFWVGAWWLRAYWFAFAMILMVVAHLVWPRGTDARWISRWKRLKPGLRGTPLALIGLGLAVMIGTGSYAWYNFKILNRYETSEQAEKFQADYEKKYLKYETLPRPVIKSVKLDAQVFPKERKLDVTGSYVLRNNTDKPITEVHVRQGSREADYSRLTLSGAKLASDDKKFGYRIFRFDTPMQPGAEAQLEFASRIWHRGFRNGMPETNIALNGTFVNNFEFAPMIGMNRQGSIQDRTVRRRQGLPAELRAAKLEDETARAENYVRTDWVMSDITITTDADQVPIAPGRKLADANNSGSTHCAFRIERADPKLLFDPVGAVQAGDQGS